MLSKNQKVWAWVFGALFLVPEILWSPIVNLYYEFTQTGRSGGTFPLRDSFLQNSDNINYLKFVLFLQFVGAATFFITWLLNIKNTHSKPLAWSIAVISFIIALVSFLAFLFVLTFHPNLVW